ncbi:MAG TPA: S9 family peptidase [Terriglobia bacterium]|nr:S9 family peptidase [Terriglobia bacterium]
MRKPLAVFPALLAAAAVSLAAASPQAAQTGKKLLTPEIVTAGGLRGGGIFRVTWRPGSDQVAFLRREGSGAQVKTKLVLHDAITGHETDVPEPGGHHLTLQSYLWSPKGDRLLLQGGSDLWLMDVANDSVRQLTDDPREKEDVTFSPAGDRVAFVEDSNIYTVELATGLLKKLTADGDGTLMNGKLDWVYEEELANRSTGRAYEWSPDGKAIAYLSLDDAPVPQYPLTHYLSDHVTLTEERFPQAGDPNPKPAMHVVTVSAGETQSRTYSLTDPAVEYFSPSFTWTADAKSVAFSTLDRHQAHLAVHLWDPVSGADRQVVDEKDPYWINSLDAPYFTKDGEHFLWLSERDGWLHLYLYNLDGTLVRELGSGNWMIDHPTFSDVPMFQVDEAGGWVYFTSTDPDPRERQNYRAKMDTGTVERLSKEPGTHGLSLSPDGRFLVDTFSNLTTPPETRLLNSDGTMIATLNRAPNPWADYALGSTELLSIKAADGATLYARLVKPPGFDPKKKYPVIVDVYGGPHVQLIRNAWGVTGPDDQLLSEQGYVIWSLDNRGSWGRGHSWESAIFEHMGQHEVEDQLAGVDYLKALPYIDPARIGVRGWSYGGYMTLELLTHAPEVFKCGAAGGPVTAWQFYDSIYTERYMRTPKENPAGYHDSSPLYFAAKLKAKVLLMHGTDDDNVHMQNTMNFVEALVKARTPFELYLQPGEKHGFAGEPSRLYLSHRLLAFFKANL